MKRHTNKVTNDLQFHLSGRATDTVVYAPYPWAGHKGNDRGRSDSIARLSGYDVVTAQAPGTRRIFLDNTTRRALRPESVESLVVNEAASLAEELKKYSVRIAMGDSARGIWVMLLQLTPTPPFTHILVRDGINLFPQQRFARDVLRAISRASHPGETSYTPPPRAKQSLAQGLYSAVTAALELYYNQELLRGTVAVNVARELAATTEIPFQNVALGHGISGTAQQVVAMNEELMHIRDAATTSTGKTKAPFIGTFEPTWGHGKLMDPEGVVTHLRISLGLPPIKMSQRKTCRSI